MYVSTTENNRQVPSMRSFHTPVADGRAVKGRELEEILAELIVPGMTVGLGGASLRRRPTALVNALANLGVTNLRLVTWVGSVDIDYLMALGVVREIDCAYVGFGPLGLSYTSRRVAADGAVIFYDWSEVSLASALEALAGGEPYAFAEDLVGTDLAAGLGEERLQTIRSPFDGREVTAVRLPAIDVSLLHWPTADEAGNLVRSAPREDDDLDRLFAAASSTTVASVEERVAVGDSRERVVVPRQLLSHVAVCPGGAKPTSCDGHYGADLNALSRYRDASKDGDLTAVSAAWKQAVCDPVESKRAST
jgi:glutaconate CoA-transferase, subunit A